MVYTNKLLLRRHREEHPVASFRDSFLQRCSNCFQFPRSNCSIQPGHHTSSTDIVSFHAPWSTVDDSHFQQPPESTILSCTLVPRPFVCISQKRCSIIARQFGLLRLRAHRVILVYFVFLRFLKVSFSTVMLRCKDNYWIRIKMFLFYLCCKIYTKFIIDFIHFSLLNIPSDQLCDSEIVLMNVILFII